MDRISVLDNGYVQFVEKWGSDEDIISAARMSTGKGFLGWGEVCNGTGCEGGQIRTMDGDQKCPKCEGKGGTVGDEKLLRYLYENRHSTPFEMGGLVIEVQAPIFIFREWYRHRTQSYNEMSARYIPLPDVNYIPTVERLMTNSQTGNKQAGTIKDAEVLDQHSAERFRQGLEQHYAEAEGLYQWALQRGVPKELARIHLPVGRYSRMRASANLRNWLGFLTLRMAPAAQWEIRQYANVVSDLVQRCFPRTHELFMEGFEKRS